MDDITFINSNILNDGFTEKLLGFNSYSGIILIANSLIVGLAIWYAIRYLFSTYTNTQIEKPYQFIFKLIVISICVNSSFFLCDKVLEINFLISGAIRSLGEHYLDTSINFEQLILKINTMFYTGTTLNVFSFDGIIKSFTSFGLFGLLFSYSLRYIMVKVFILMTPLVIITLLNSSTSWIFKSWMKSVFSLLIVQSLISLILLIIFSTTFVENSVFSKLVYIGAIYALMKANTYTGQMFGGIVTEVSVGFSNMKKLLN